MTSDQITDGRRITELLASEVTARSDGPLSSLELVDVQSDAEGSEDGTFAYGIAVDEETELRLADVYVHDERARLEFRTGLDPIPAAAKEANLRVRPKAVEPPRVLVFVEDGGAVKRALDVIRVAVRAVRE